MHPAPGPEEVNWQHLWLNWRQRDLRTVLTWPLMLVVVFFPITGFTSAVAKLQYVLCPVNSSLSGGQLMAQVRLAGRGTAVNNGCLGTRCPQHRLLPVRLRHSCITLLQPVEKGGWLVSTPACIHWLTFR